jgi:hypothetical protein
LCSCEIPAQPIVSFLFDLEVKLTPPAARSGAALAVAIVRRSGTLDLTSPLASQLFLCQVNDAAPLDTMLSYVRHCFLPVSRSLLSADSLRGDGPNSANAGLFD